MDLKQHLARPSKWGNLWIVGLVACGCRSAGECDHNRWRRETAAEAVVEYQVWILSNVNRIRRLDELRGKSLACWCPLDKPCHADVLLELANQ